MKQFTIKLLEDIQRPVIRLEAYTSVRAMLDTGALFPVWVEPVAYLQKVLGAKLYACCQSYSGFGGQTQGDVYRIPLLRIGKLLFPNLWIITGDTRVPCQMILSATMFHNLIYEIDNQHHILNVTVPDQEDCIRNIVIRDSNGITHILCAHQLDSSFLCNSDIHKPDF